MILVDSRALRLWAPTPTPLKKKHRAAAPPEVNGRQPQPICSGLGIPSFLFFPGLLPFGICPLPPLPPMTSIEYKYTTQRFQTLVDVNIYTPSPYGRQSHTYRVTYRSPCAYSGE